MATAKKPAAKKAPAKKVVAKKAVPKKQAPRLLVSERTVAKAPPDQKFAMPREVSDWIERANATINHLRGKVERLERENKDLKAYRKFAEGRILNVSHE
jgi:endo-beta-N-acetylglucosaminidase D